jgi:hypothetical protein
VPTILFVETNDIQFERRSPWTTRAVLASSACSVVGLCFFAIGAVAGNGDDSPAVDGYYARAEVATVAGTFLLLVAVGLHGGLRVRGWSKAPLVLNLLPLAILIRVVSFHLTHTR